MKTIKLSILFLVQILLLSCSEQVYVDGTSKQVIKRDKMITQAISQLTPQNKLLVEEINKNVQDTILERLNMNIAGRWNDSSLSLTLMKSTIKFVPVIDSPSRLYLVNDSEKVFRIPEKFACFYGQNDNGETIYFYAIYHAENFTKEANLENYQGYAEVFGQDAADKMVLHAALKILNEEERQIVLLRTSAGLKHREIAADLEMPLATVLSKYNRAMKKLKKHLREEGVH